MLNLSSTGSSEIANTPQTAMNMFGSRVSLQPAAPNFMKHPAYAPPQPAAQVSSTNKLNGHYPYHPAVQSSSRPSAHMHDDPILKWIQQVNNSSSINGLASSSQNSMHNNGGINRSQAPVYPYGSYISTGAGKLFCFYSLEFHQCCSKVEDNHSSLHNIRNELLCIVIDRI
jgi:hypothetical protein